MNLRDLPLGSTLVRDSLASPATVRDALFEARETDRPARRGHAGTRLDRRTGPGAAPRRAGAARVRRPRQVNPSEAALDELPEPVAQRAQAIAYGFHDDELLVAVGDPTDEHGLSELRDALDRPVRFMVAVPSEIEALSGAFGKPLLRSA
jgi:hypothetical protein